MLKSVLGAFNLKFFAKLGSDQFPHTTATNCSNIPFAPFSPRTSS